MRRALSAIKLAIRNLLLHKLRAFLTVLGLIFGVASVVAMLAIAEGAGLQAQREIAGLGATNIILQSKKPLEDAKPPSGDESFILAYGLTNADYERIVETVPSVTGAMPLREFRKPVRHLENEVEGRIVGVNPDFRRISHLVVHKGRFLSDADLSVFANVCVLGSEIAEKLFPFGDALGQTVRVGETHYYRVVGVTGYRAPSAGTGSSLAAQDFNRDVYIPITTDRVRNGDTIVTDKQGSMTAEKIELSQITVAVDEMDNVKRTSEAIKSMLKQAHEKEDYSVTVPLELLEKAEKTKQIFNLVLGSIASISLIVGGIGIMNIMLATVTERTREIGIRRALGARRRDITFQFLVETAVMSSTGGLIGVLVGMAVPPLVSQVSGMPAIIKPWSPILAFLIAVGIGVVFGVYPARRAASMDPVEALRAE
jgi:putative ABC transport system permease protein